MRTDSQNIKKKLFLIFTFFLTMKLRIFCNPKNIFKFLKIMFLKIFVNNFLKFG